MAENVQCPVCTLFLHAGMSLSHHLETHPKEQVIEALVELTFCKTAGGEGASAAAALSAALDTDRDEKHTKTETVECEATETLANNNTPLNYATNKPTQKPISAAAAPPPPLSLSLSSESNKLLIEVPPPTNNFDIGYRHEDCAANENIKTSPHVYQPIVVDPYKHRLSQPAQTQLIPSQLTPLAMSVVPATQQSYTHENSQLQDIQVKNICSDDYSVGSQQEHNSSVVLPSPPSSTILSSTSPTLQQQQQSHAFLPQHSMLAQQSQKNVKIVFSKIMPPQPTVQLFSYQNAKLATSHQKPPPAYVTAISQIRSQHNLNKHLQQQQQHQSQPQQQHPTLSTIQQQLQRQQQSHMRQQQQLPTSLVTKQQQQIYLQPPSALLPPPPPLSQPEQLALQISHNEDADSRYHLHQPTVHENLPNYHQHHLQQQYHGYNYKVHQQHTSTTLIATNTTTTISMSGVAPPKTTTATTTMNTSKSMMSNLTTTTRPQSAPVMTRQTNSPYPLNASLASPSVLRYAESPVAHYLERDNGDFIVQETPKHIVECVETDNGEFSVIERIYQSPPSVLHIHDDVDNENDNEESENNVLEAKVNKHEKDEHNQVGALDMKNNNEAHQEIPRKTTTGVLADLSNDDDEFMSVSGGETEQDSDSDNEEVEKEKSNGNNNKNNNSNNNIDEMARCSTHSINTPALTSVKSRKSSKNSITVLSDVQLNLNEYLDLVGNIIASSKITGQRLQVPRVKVEKEEPVDNDLQEQSELEEYDQQKQQQQYEYVENEMKEMNINSLSSTATLEDVDNAVNIEESIEATTTIPPKRTGHNNNNNNSKNSIKTENNNNNDHDLPTITTTTSKSIRNNFTSTSNLNLDNEQSIVVEKPIEEQHKQSMKGKTEEEEDKINSLEHKVEDGKMENYAETSVIRMAITSQKQQQQQQSEQQELPIMSTTKIEENNYNNDNNNQNDDDVPMAEDLSKTPKTKKDKESAVAKAMNNNESKNIVLNEQEFEKKFILNAETLTLQQQQTHLQAQKKGPKKLIIKPKSTKTEQQQQNKTDILTTATTKIDNDIDVEEKPTTSAAAAVKHKLQKQQQQHHQMLAINTTTNSSTSIPTSPSDLLVKHETRTIKTTIELEKLQTKKDELLLCQEENTKLPEYIPYTDLKPHTEKLSNAATENNVNAEDDARMLLDFAHSKKHKVATTTASATSATIDEKTGASFLSSISIFSNIGNSNNENVGETAGDMKGNITTLTNSSESYHSRSVSTNSLRCDDEFIPLEVNDADNANQEQIFNNNHNNNNNNNNYETDVATLNHHQSLEQQQQQQQQQNNTFADYPFSFIYGANASGSHGQQDDIPRLGSFSPELYHHQHHNQQTNDALTNAATLASGSNSLAATIEDSSSTNGTRLLNQQHNQNHNQSHHHQQQQQQQQQNFSSWYQQHAASTDFATALAVDCNNAAVSMPDAEGNKYLDLDFCKRESSSLTQPPQLAPSCTTTTSSSSFAAANESSLAGGDAALNIRTDEKMPAKGEISEQESNCDIENSWSQPVCKQLFSLIK